MSLIRRRIGSSVDDLLSIAAEVARHEGYFELIAADVQALSQMYRQHARECIARKDCFDFFIQDPHIQL